MAQQQHHQQWIISPTTNSVNKSFETTSSSSSFAMDPATPHGHAMHPPPSHIHNLAAKGTPPQAHPYQLNSPPLPPSHQVITPTYPPPPAFLPTPQTQPQPQQHYVPPHSHHHLLPQHMIQHNVYAPEMASGISPLPPPYPHPPQQTPTVYPFPSPPLSSGYHPVQAPAATTAQPAQPALTVVQLSSPPSLPQHQPHTFLPSPQFQLQPGAMLQPQVVQPAVYAAQDLVFHPASDSGPRQLMITFLEPDVSNAELHAAFAVIGPVDAARVIYDKGTGKSKCFGFVYYRYSRDAATATQCMSGHPIRGKRIKVIFASPQRPLPPSEL